MNQSHSQLVKTFVDTALKVKQVIEQNSTMEEKGLTILQNQSLCFIRDHSGCSVGDLAQELLISISSTTQLTNRLADAKLITRQNDKNDRRVIKLAITKSGSAKITEFDQTFYSSHFSTFKNISEKDLIFMLKIFDRILAIKRKDSKNEK